MGVRILREGFARSDRTYHPCTISLPFTYLRQDLAPDMPILETHLLNTELQLRSVHESGVGGRTEVAGTGVRRAQLPRCAVRKPYSSCKLDLIE